MKSLLFAGFIIISFSFISKPSVKRKIKIPGLEKVRWDMSSKQLSKLPENKKSVQRDWGMTKDGETDIQWINHTVLNNRCKVIFYRTDPLYDEPNGLLNYIEVEFQIKNRIDANEKFYTLKSNLDSIFGNGTIKKIHFERKIAIWKDSVTNIRLEVQNETSSLFLIIRRQPSL